MPITPYHFGPGVALKACVPRCFSLSAYVLAQFIIDLEPLYFLVKDEYPWHRFMHTFSGATLVAALVVLFTPLCRQLIGGVRQRLGNLDGKLPAVTRFAIVCGAVVGAYGHIAFDSVMHTDVFPLSGISQASPWYGAMPLDVLQGVCIVTGLVGLAIMGLRTRRPM